MPSIVLRKFSKPPVRLLLEQRRVQVAAGAPFAVGDVFQAGGHQHERKDNSFTVALSDTRSPARTAETNSEGNSRARRLGNKMSLVVSFALDPARMGRCGVGRGWMPVHRLRAVEEKRHV